MTGSSSLLLYLLFVHAKAHCYIPSHIASHQTQFINFGL